MTIETPLKIKTKTDSSERNARYIARREENQGILIEHGTPIHDGGFQYFSYYNHFPFDGDISKHYNGYIVVDIICHANKYVMLKWEAQAPDTQRPMNTGHIMYNSYKDIEQAKEEAINKIIELNEWVVSDWWNSEPLAEIEEDLFYDWIASRGDFFHQMKHDGTIVVKLVGDHNKVKFNVDLNKHKHNEHFRVNII